MKKCLSPNDLLELSEMQKSALRNLWQPNKYDLALEIVWKDVENDIYDGVMIMVMDASAVASHAGYCEVVLRVFYPDGPPQYECLAGDVDDEENDADLTETDVEDMEDTGSSTDDETAASTERFLSKENCLPLLNIGQMVEILYHHKGEPNISFTPEEAICYVNGEEFSGEELCDVLWEAVKTLL